MKVRIHRGTQQIGGTCIELAAAGDRIALDFGLPLDGDATDTSLVPEIVGGDIAHQPADAEKGRHEGGCRADAEPAEIIG